MLSTMAHVDPCMYVDTMVLTVEKDDRIKDGTVRTLGKLAI